ncbi:DUF4349 domain-containing protein [bacterium]|nr:DUF4349 domain-containing protein [bacterium]
MLRAPCLILMLALGGCAAAMAPAVPAQNAVPAAPGGKAASRKIIDRVSLDLRVDDLTTFNSQLMAAVSSTDGYLSQSQLRLAQHFGKWTVRVPTERLSEFLVQAQVLGTVLGSHSSAEDVTEQFIDIEARLTTKRVEEERLKTLLTEQTGTLTDVLQVEKELHRVREEIEQAEGRLRSLDDLTQFATVEITATVHAPIGWIPDGSLGQQIVGVFKESCRLLIELLRTGLLIAVAFLPWLIAALPEVLLIYWLAKRGSSKKKSSPIFQ